MNFKIEDLNKEELTSFILQATQKIAQMEEQLATKNASQGSLSSDSNVRDYKNEDVSETETLRSMVGLDKINASALNALFLMEQFESIRQSRLDAAAERAMARRQAEELFSERMSRRTTGTNYHSAKWQQELRHADIATDAQWIDGGDGTPDVEN